MFFAQKLFNFENLAKKNRKASKLLPLKAVESKTIGFLLMRILLFLASKEVKHRHKRDFDHPDYELSFGDLNTETSYEVSHDVVNTFEDLQHEHAFNAAAYQDVDPVMENLVFEDDDENKNAFDAGMENFFFYFSQSFHHSS